MPLAIGTNPLRVTSSGGTSTATTGVPSLQAFDALTPRKKLEALFPAYNPSVNYARLAPTKDLTRSSVKLEKSLQEDLLQRAVRVRGKLARALERYHGDSLRLTALAKGKTVYAYAFELRGLHDGEWNTTEVYDRSFNRIGSFGWSR